MMGTIANPFVRCGCEQTVQASDDEGMKEGDADEVARGAIHQGLPHNSVRALDRLDEGLLLVVCGRHV